MNELEATHDSSERQETIELELQLNEGQMAAKAAELGAISLDIRNLEEEFSAVKNEWKDRIAKKQKVFDDLLDVVRAGKEKRALDCTVKLYYQSNTVEYWHEGALVHERSMTPEERQQELPIPDNVEYIRRPSSDFEDEEPVNAATIDAGEMPKEIREDDVTRLKTQGEQIQDIIREETRRTSKSSAVDGPTE